MRAPSMSVGVVCDCGLLRGAVAVLWQWLCVRCKCLPSVESRCGCDGGQSYGWQGQFCGPCEELDDWDLRVGDAPAQGSFTVRVHGSSSAEIVPL